MSARRQWFEVDHDGLAELAKRRGMAFIITEPIQNAWDENSTRIDVELTAVPGAPKVDITVRDDSPDGFRDLGDSYMMFRSSYKLANPEQRGRFNIGEKLLLAVADSARIESTTGSVVFDRTGRKTAKRKTETGSVLTARLRMTREELEEALGLVRRLIPPAGKATVINGLLLPARTPAVVGERSLETEVQGPEGGFRYLDRKTEIRVYEPLLGEKAHIYEMGIPIDELDCPWHVEVMQKVPLSMDRSSVRWGYLDVVQRAAAEMMAKRMKPEQSREGWVTKALDFMHDDEAVKEIITKRFGKAVIFDPSAPESNKLALDAGYHVVSGRELSKYAWETVKRVGVLKPAGQVFDTGRVKVGPDGVPPVGRSAWTAAMQRLADYAGAFAEHTLGHGMQVEFYDHPHMSFTAFCGNGVIGFQLGGPTGLRKAVESKDQLKLDALLIHECAHDKVSDHLTHEFHRECCRIGALARTFEEKL